MRCLRENLTPDYFLLPGINVFDSFHIVFAIMESFRLTFDEYYPNFLLHSFPWFHFPIYRITLAGSIYMMIATAIGKLVKGRFIYKTAISLVRNVCISLV